MQPIRTVVAAVDFSHASRLAIEQALRLATRHRATLHVVHVIESLVLHDLATALGHHHGDLAAHVVRDTEVALARFLVDLERPPHWRTSVRVGSPANELLAYAGEVGADLLVLGASGADGTGSGIGTIAARCVRKARCRALLVRGNWRGPARLVMAGVDFSAVAPRALDEALGLAGDDEARLEVVHVFQGPWHRLHYQAPTPQTDPAFHLAYERALTARLEALVAPIAAGVPSVAVGCRLREHPNDGRGLAAEAGERQADLLVVGTRGRGNLRELLLGSTAERVLADAACSILTVPPEQGAGGPA